MQACALRGHVERPSSINEGNFLELLKLIASYNKEVENVVLANAPQNAKYISPDVEKEILQIFARNVQQSSRDEIGNAKFRLIVDESRDESKKEEMAIVVRFVDRNGHAKERFLDLIHGYDGANNMHGEWQGLQTLMLKECPYAYYIHYFAKRHHQLQDAQISEISVLAENGELEMGKGENQIQSLQRPGDTRWSSHYRSICVLLRLYSLAVAVLRDIVINRCNASQKSDASYALTHLLSFDFVIILHLMKKIMKKTDTLSQAFQRKSQDIVNALSLVSTTKTLIQNLRDQGWQSLLNKVVSYCESNKIEVPKMNNVTVEHHYRIDVFFAAIDSQLQELNSRFNEFVIELLRLSVALNSKKSFNENDICSLAKRFYPLDFTEQENIQLESELRHYEFDVLNHPELQKVHTIAKLCRGLKQIGRVEVYPMLDRLIHLVLTLPVLIATSEKAFSAMKIVKMRLHSSMGDEFLKSCLIPYIESKIADTFTSMR
ncbi:uncharacterized protein [Rutidosis leptorrhynchoides]|uniref:uncharacterized protein n=1 Tax=Rutidosis leptorrhynchoides TaxID=125765 RepID=UPI003A991822